MKNVWKKFKKFYKEKFEKNKILTIILTIIITPILIYLLYYAVIVVLAIIAAILLLWFIKLITIGPSKKSSYSSDKSRQSSVGASSGKKHYGYTEEEVIAIMEANPKLNMAKYDWYTLAEALDESKYNKKIKVMYSGEFPIFIFPRDQKPRMNFHLFEDSTIESGGGLFEKAKEHFTTKELNSGEICVIYDGKRLTSKDM